MQLPSVIIIIKLKLYYVMNPLLSDARCKRQNQLTVQSKLDDFEI